MRHSIAIPFSAAAAIDSAEREINTRFPVVFARSIAACLPLLYEPVRKQPENVSIAIAPRRCSRRDTRRNLFPLYNKWPPFAPGARDLGTARPGRGRKQ